ncbi:MAG: metallophosphoesterase [Oscillospiraceae bacterium]|nr:metallophosphoesterase [Oscillospiraceae bacterium]
MSLYAIGDLHLSLSADKPMDVFGGRWEQYMEKIKIGFSHLKSDDVTVLCGDITWGMHLEDCLADFQYIDHLPGKKIILKGNHDYWWTTATKAGRFFEAYGLTSIALLHNNCHFYEGVAICGTRGWFYEEETHGEHDKKILNREIMRLEASLKAAGDREKLCFLHYPPRYRDYVCREIIDVMAAYGVKRCFYGHIHGSGFKHAVEGLVEGIVYKMVSADAVQFSPYKIL